MYFASTCDLVNIYEHIHEQVGGGHKQQEKTYDRPRPNIPNPSPPIIRVSCLPQGKLVECSCLLSCCLFRWYTEEGEHIRSYSDGRCCAHSCCFYRSGVVASGLGLRGEVALSISKAGGGWVISAGGAGGRSSSCSIIFR